MTKLNSPTVENPLSIASFKNSNDLLLKKFSTKKQGIFFNRGNFNFLKHFSLKYIIAY